MTVAAGAPLGSLGPAEWVAGVRAIWRMDVPQGFVWPRWQLIQQDAAELLRHHGAELHRLGWSDIDLFGVHPTVPGVAVHCAGLAVLLGGGRLVEVAPEHAAFVRPSGARLTYARRPSPEAVPLWDLAA